MIDQKPQSTDITPQMESNLIQKPILMHLIITRYLSLNYSRTNNNSHLKMNIISHRIFQMKLIVKIDLAVLVTVIAQNGKTISKLKVMTLIITKMINLSKSISIVKTILTMKIVMIKVFIKKTIFKCNRLVKMN